jgi:hypothetical protein
MSHRLKVLYISGSAEDFGGHRARPAGGDAFLPKPFSLELAGRVREVLAGSLPR